MSLRVVTVHNRYVNRGGEDVVFEAESTLLKNHGCYVKTITAQTQAPQSLLAGPQMAIEATWSRKWSAEFKRILDQEQPDVVHVHNSFPLMSPSIYYACHEAGVPVVQTLHNYRLLCPGALFFRDGKVCEDCTQHGLLRGVAHGCYRGSRPQTAAVVGMLATHRTLGTWSEKVDCYIALTEFARQKFIAGGLPAEKIVVKPNFHDPDPGMRESLGEGAVFVGRLDEQKGVRTLFNAWQKFNIQIPLNIIGDGPLLEELRRRKEDSKLERVSIEGRKSHGETLAAIQSARFLIFPSQWYECFPVTLVEAFASGVPVVASRLGAMAEIIEDRHTGILFNPGDPADLAQKIEWTATHPAELQEIGRACRREYELRYTAEKNFEQLISIYHQAISQRTLVPV
jgi:glycosyltransferase involved in cell wall biosynthesis